MAEQTVSRERRPAFRAIEPAQFPWFDYRGYTFSLGLALGRDVINSGHSGSSFDPAKGKPDVSGGMGEQARTAYAKQAAVLAAAGLTMGDVTRVVENVTLAGLPHYAEAVEARREVFGPHRPTVTTVVVDRLVRAKAFIEVEVQAAPGGGPELVTGPEEGWRHDTVRGGHDGAVLLPMLLPLDADGRVVAPGDLAGQYEFCLTRGAELLDRAGLSMSHLVSTVDYTTPATRAQYSQLAAVRRSLLGAARPAAAGILMSRLHADGVLVAIEAVASTHPVEPVNPGWSRYDSLTYSPAVRAGNTLYLSGFASMDMQTQQATNAGDLRAQAESTYDAMARTLAAAGATPADLLTTVEYVTPAGLPDYRAVADVRAQVLSDPYPASTGIVCGALLRDEFLLEVVSTAVLPAADPAEGEP